MKTHTPAAHEAPESQYLFKQACDNCDSSDGMAVYDDGHTYCFVCQHRKPPTSGEHHHQQPAAPRKAQTSADFLKPDPTATNKGLQKRGLKPETLRRFGYFLSGFKGSMVQVAQFTNEEGAIVHQKLRLPSKEFLTLGNGPGLTKCQLFGTNVWGDRFDRRVAIFEGELDAMTGAQETNFKFPCVSVNGGAAAAVKNIKHNYLWLDRFQEIVLWFDDDEPGREASEEVAKLFKVGKVRIAKVAGFKDCSEVLQANRPGDIEAAIFGASVWRPRGIINARDNVQDVLAPKQKVSSWSYPPMMAKLQEMTKGIHRGEVIYHVAGTGVGKSSALREIQYHLMEQNAKIAVLSFEDTIREAKMGLMSIKANQRLQLIEEPDPEDLKAVEAYDSLMTMYHTSVFGGGLVELFDPETAEWSMEAILGYVRYCARALDCEIIFIDPLSFIASGIELTADERRVLDKVASEFAKMAKELNISLQISHHLKRTSGIPHEEGAPTSLNELRSSGGMANFAMGVIGWERNAQAPDELWRVTQSRIIKPIRRTGKSGIADVLMYGENGRLITSPHSMPPPGKPSDKQLDAPPFGALGDKDY